MKLFIIITMAIVTAWWIITTCLPWLATLSPMAWFKIIVGSIIVGGLALVVVLKADEYEDRNQR